MTEIQTRLLAEGGPAVLFENVRRADGSRSPIPVLVNLFGTVERVAWGMEREPHQLREVGETLAFLKQPEPPGGWREALEMLPLLKTVMTMRPSQRCKAGNLPRTRADNWIGIKSASVRPASTCARVRFAFLANSASSANMPAGPRVDGYD